MSASSPTRFVRRNFTRLFSIAALLGLANHAAASDHVVVSDHLTLAHEALIKAGKTIRTEDPWKKNFPTEEG